MKAELNEFTQILETWYSLNARDLPWRRTRDPYAIWISEIILQQTRVAQGLEYYQRFMQRFPDVFSLADASEDEVLRYWQGLGYYSRARNLHAAAKSIAEKGAFPIDYPSVRALKGIGDYTASAICSMAFGLPYAVVDGNVYRVLSRYFLINEPIDSTKGKKLFAGLAKEMLDNQNPGLYNQAIMDFGATVCTPKAALCTECPLADSCGALSEGRVEQLPVKAHKTQVTDRFFHYILVRRGEHFLLHQRKENDIWRNLYEVPLVEVIDRLLNENQLIENKDYLTLKQLFTDADDAVLRLLRHQTIHQLSHRRIHAQFLALESNKEELPVPPSGYLWVHRSKLDDYAVSRLVSMLFEDFFQNLD